MRDRRVTRRQAIQAATPLFAVVALGCASRSSEQTEQTRRGAQVTPMAKEPEPMLGWQVIVSGNAGPGPRSRHTLVYDRQVKVAVLFGGIIWSPESLQSDTWELRGGNWMQVRTTATPPARHR